MRTYLTVAGLLSFPNTTPENCDEIESSCMAPGATIKNDDDDIKINHHQKAKEPKLAASLWRTTPARLRR
jgi:hypothetical protein